MGEEKSKVERKTTELYIGGLLRMGTDMKHAISNFRFIASLITPDFDKSEMWKALKEYEGTLQSDNGRRFIDTQGHNVSIALNLLLDCQEIVAPFSPWVGTADFAMP